jgi:hypothetical protein
VTAFEERLWWAIRPQWLWRLLRLSLRSFWIAAAVAASGWLASRAAGWPVPLLAWLAGGFALFMLLLSITALWPLSLRQIAQRVDGTFGLADRMVTAHEIARRAPRNYVEARLIENSQRQLARVRARLLRAPRVPWVDLELCLLAILGLYACFLLSGPPAPLSAEIPPPAFEPLAPLSGPVEVPLPGAPPELSGSAAAPAPGGQPIDPAAAQQALEALAEALGQQSITQAAGDALGQGNAEQAAEALRELADQADGLSEAAREALADSLRQAAEDTANASPEIAQEILESANALEYGNATGALEDLAQLVEDLDAARQGGLAQEEEQPGAGSGAGQGAGSGSGGTTGRETQPEGSTERLQGESEVVDLPEDEATGDSVLQPPRPDSEASEQRSTPYTHTGASGSGGSPGTDPLSFPWRLRDVVQKYFSPR